MTRPSTRPGRPFFSSGPCAKRPGWTSSVLDNSILGRSHRSKPCKARLAAVIARSREILGVPDDYRLGIVPASDTGAVEMALWTLLGPRPVTVLSFESFSEEWAKDVTVELSLPAEIRRSPYGRLPDLTGIDKGSDVVFAWNGTTSGVCMPDADWIASDRAGITICDATSAAFAMELPWEKLDVVTWSWQKALGGEAGHGMIALSPRAAARLHSYRPSWPLPKIFRLARDGKLIEGVFAGETINTPSMLCVEDQLDALDWAQRAGGLAGLVERSKANADTLANWVARSEWAAFLAEDAATRSTTSVCLRFSDPWFSRQDTASQQAFAAALASRLEMEGVAFDVGAYRDAPPGLRIWCGATVERDDVDALLPWLDWAYAATKTTSTKTA